MPALTSLTNVKNWLSVETSADDVLLTGLINQLSAAALNYIQRPNIARATYTELRCGVGNARMTLRNYPIVEVASVTVGSATIPASTGLGLSGYTISGWDGTSAGNPQEITLNGYVFCRGLNNVQIVYDAGYCVSDEAQTVSSATPYSFTAAQPNGRWSQDDGANYANGAPLTRVDKDPATGQYSINPDTGVYTFSSGDAAEDVLISYSYIPSALEEALIEWVGERYRYKQRIGQVSKSLGGNETASYNLNMPDHIKLLFEPYMKWFPL